MYFSSSTDNFENGGDFIISTSLIPSPPKCPKDHCNPSHLVCIDFINRFEAHIDQCISNALSSILILCYGIYMIFPFISSVFNVFHKFSKVLLLLPVLSLKWSTHAS
jgi:hypothetical protein